MIHHGLREDDATELTPSADASLLHSEHFVTNNAVINFHLLFKHISLLDKIGHISAA